MIYQGLTDGQSHTYSFYSIGLDAAGNLQSAPSGPNVTFANQVFAQPGQLQVTGFTVEHGSPSRSLRPLPRPRGSTRATARAAAS